MIEQWPSTPGVRDVDAVLASILRHAPFGFALHSPDHRYLMVNEALAEMNGASVAEHLGRSIHEMVPDLCEQGIAVLDQVRDTGVPVTDVEVVGETPADPGRRRVWLESFYPVHGADGELVGVAAVARDVTEERDLAEWLSSERFRAALDSALDAVLLLSVDLGGELRVDYVNRAQERVSGIPRDEQVGRRFTQVFPGVAATGLAERYLDVAATGEPWSVTDFPYPVDGREVVIDVSATEFRGGVMVTWRDVTARHLLVRQRVQLDQDRRRIRRMQRTFLPRALPRVAGVELAAQYLSADGDDTIGGDWYDAVVVGDELVLVVGDVAGHGLTAVETMGIARFTARAYAIEDPDPQRIMERLSAYAAHAQATTGVEVFVTCVAVRYAPATRTLRWSSAGHPPPLLVAPDGGRLLESPHGPPLGTPHARYTDSERVLDPGDTLVLYTDGLVERRGEVIDTGLARLVTAARHLPVPVDAACAAVVERLAGRPPRTDDVCVLALRAGTGPSGDRPEPRVEPVGGRREERS